MSTVSIRYMIDDVLAAIKFYTTHLGFALDIDASPAFASVSRDGCISTALPSVKKGVHSSSIFPMFEDWLATEI